MVTLKRLISKQNGILFDGLTSFPLRGHERRSPITFSFFNDYGMITTPAKLVQITNNYFKSKRTLIKASFKDVAVRLKKSFDLSLI